MANNSLNAGHATPIDRLKTLISIEQEDIKTVIFYAIGIGFMALATPVAVQALVNTIAFGALFQPLLVLTMILLVLVGFSNVLAGLQFYVVDMLQRRLFVRLFDAAAQRLQQVDYSVRDKQHLPELANRFLDVVTLQKTAAVLLLETLGYVLQTVIGMLLLAFYHPMLLAFDLFLIAALAFILFVLGKHGIETGIEQSKAKYSALAWLETLAACPLMTKSDQNQAFIKSKTEAVVRYYLATSARHFRILARQNTGALVLHTLANTLLLGMGGWMVIDRQLSLGQLIAAELVVSAMIYGLTRLGKTLDNFYELLASMDKLGHLLDLPPEPNQVLVPYSAGNNPFRVDLIDITTPSSPHLDAMNQLSLRIEPGESIAIDGGCAKGTLFDLVFGLRMPSQGYIVLDNQDIRDVNIRKLRENIALVRETEIIESTIADNVSLGSSAVISDIKQALTVVGLMEVVATFPEGVNTVLVANGEPLTREQCLRLMIARAIVGNPKLLLLDGVLDRIEATDAKAILTKLTDVSGAWTLIVSTQIGELAAVCSRQLHIENGVVLENERDSAEPT